MQERTKHSTSTQSTNHKDKVDFKWKVFSFIFLFIFISFTPPFQVFLCNFLHFCLLFSSSSNFTAIVTKKSTDKLCRYIVTSSADKTVRVHCPETGERIKQMKGHSTFVNDCDTSPENENEIVSVSDDCTAKVLAFLFYKFHLSLISFSLLFSSFFLSFFL